MHAGACIRMTNAVTILRNSDSYGPSNADGSGARRICRACSPDLVNVTKRESLGPLRHVIGLPALRRHRVWRGWMVAVPEMRALFHSYPGRTAPRYAALSGQELGARRCAAIGRNGDGRAQDGGDLSTLCDRGCRAAQGRRGEDRSRGRDNFRDNRPIRQRTSRKSIRVTV